MTTLTSAPGIKVNGTVISDKASAALLDVRVSRSSGAASHALLRFNDVHAADRSLTLGAEIIVDSYDADAKRTSVLFKGEIVSKGIETALGSTQLTVEAFDASYALGSEIQPKSHLKKSAAEVIKEIAGEAGLTATVTSMMAKPKFEHMQQSGTSHQFLTELTSYFGCEWFVDDGKLIVQERSTGAANITFDGEKDLRYFTARVTAMEQAKEVSIRSWDPSQNKEAVTSKARFDKKMHGRKVPAEDGVRGKVPPAISVAPRSLFAGGHAKKVAEGASRRLAASMLTGRGEVDVDARLKPGTRIKIENVATDWNGEYYVTSVDHVFGWDQPFISRFTIGPLEPAALVDLFDGSHRDSGDRIAHGLTVGIVTDLQDPEKLRRVKVKLPYLSDDNVTDWCRILTIGGGKERGWSVVPDIDDEVLVGFEHGDLHRPYVLGGLWNKNDLPPKSANEGNEAKNDERALTSRAGHVLSFVDAASASDQAIEIRHADEETTLFLGAEKVDLLATDKSPITIKGAKGSSIEITKQGDITLKGENITIDAKKDVKINGMKVAIKGKGGFEAGGASVKVKADGMADFEGGGITSVKGTMVKIN